MKKICSNLLFLLFIFTAKFTHAESSFSIAPGLMYFHYEEFADDGSTFNKEIGFIPGITFDLQKGNHSLGVHLFDGTVEYDGFLQSLSGPLIPFETKTKESLYYFFYRYDFSQKNATSNYFISINHQFWERFIQPTATVDSSLYEEYRWWHIEAGLKIKQNIKQNLHYTIELAGLRTFNGNIFIDLEQFGSSSHNLDLGDKLGIRSLLSFDLHAASNTRISIGTEYKYWGFGKSNTEIVQGGLLDDVPIHEPRSKSNLLRFFIQFTQSF